MVDAEAVVLQEDPEVGILMNSPKKLDKSKPTNALVVTSNK